MNPPTDPPIPIRPRHLFVIAGLCVLALLPFLGKPLHVDDPMYVWAAKQITAHPLDPYGFSANWDGTLQPMPRVMQNPPLVCYYLAVAARGVGWGEVGLHAALVPVAVLAAIATYLLAARFCRRPLAASVMMLASPAFLVSSTTLMCEGPLLCLWVWTVLLWVVGSTATTAPRAWGLTLGAGVLAAAAPLAKYPGVNLIPLLAAHAVLCPAVRRRTLVPQALALLLPIVTLLAYDRATAARYGYGLVGDAVAYSGATRGANAVPRAAKALNGLCYVGSGAIPVAVVGLAIACGRAGWRPVIRRGAALLAPVALAFVAGVVYRAPPGWLRANGPPAWAYFAQYGLWAAAGVAAAIAMCGGVGNRLRDRPGLFLLLWVVGVFVFGTFLNWSINIRSFLPLLPAACILAARAADRTRSLRAIPFAVAIGAAISLAVAVADSRYAYDNRDGVDRLAARWTAAGASPSNIWFGGHWGFQYYMQQAGARPLDGDSAGYRTGDLVILPLDNTNVRPVAAQLVPLDTVYVGAGSWLTTMNLSMGGGFYVSEGDRLPFVVGPMPPEAFAVTRVGRLTAAH